MVKYVRTYSKGTLKKKKKKKKSVKNYLMLCVFSYDFLYKNMLWVLTSTALTSRCNSNGYPQHMPL